jgi:putative redox protein
MRAKRVTFKNEEGIELVGKLELPLDQQPKQFALFAHCFTCSKDLKAVQHITLALAQKGFGVLRFDFTGLGQSDGSFSDTTFTTNLNDISAAAQFLEEHYAAPSLLIGHSLGGTAVLLSGATMDSVKAVATIGAPYEPEHVLKLIKNDIQEIREKGVAEVQIAGRSFNIKSKFLEDLEHQGLEKLLNEARGKALLVMHSPQDEVVGVANARAIYDAAHHPKSFISLDGADHLLSAKEDALYVGEVIASWVQRYLDTAAKPQEQSDHQVMARIHEGPFLTEIIAGHHHLLADEPLDMGGEDLGPSPYELLSAGLGACTAMTLKMYADRKKMDISEIKVHLNYDNDYLSDCEHCPDEERKIGRFERLVEIVGNIDEAQQKRLLQIANKCPVHKTLEQGVTVKTELSIVRG